MKTQTVVCAACRLNHPEHGTIILVGARHWDGLMRSQANLLNIRGGGEEQGFVDQFGSFLTRKEALAIVKSNGQPFNQSRNSATDELYSEGLY
jgi:hypothetical protein